MPGELPRPRGYTYAAELSADEAGTSNVEFTQPVYVYVDNFLNFPIGETVPSGYYDREKGAWVASDNGRIVKVLGDGRAGGFGRGRERGAGGRGETDGAGRDG
ncbi:MAG: hypothetical protein IPK56_10920 [Elusimicrobia bacterium]|nr:hypothetical protein [Elusimicrobiota bacterium]